MKTERSDVNKFGKTSQNSKTGGMTKIMLLLSQHIQTPKAFRGLFGVLFLTISLALISCRSTQFDYSQTQVLENGVEINAYDNVFKIYKTDFEKDFKEGDKFIFIRLYFPTYKNKASGINFLRKLILSIDPTEEQITHTAIGFNLQDEFYGLTRYRPQDLKIESCLDTETNKYMKLCEEYNSLQIVLAIKVSGEEYQAAKEFVEKNYEENDIIYSISKNITAGVAGIKRKHQKTPEARTFGGTPSKKGFIDPDAEKKKKFVCSSYLAYVLVKNVQSVNDFFVEKNINYHDVIPTDFLFMPGLEKLFSSTWVDYKIAVEEFLKVEPIFIEYFSK